MRHTNGTMSSSSTSGGPVPQAMCQDEIVGGTKEVIKGKGETLMCVLFVNLKNGVPSAELRILCLDY